MNKDEILEAISNLASSQGFYGRLYEHILDDPEYLDYLESMHFKDTVDLVLYLEG